MSPSPRSPRPLAVTVIGWLFIAIGCVTILKDVAPLIVPGGAQEVARLKAQWPRELAPAWTIRFLAIVAGGGILGGRNWARWLLVLWLAFHVGLSATASLSEVAVHGALSIVVLYFLFRPRAAGYFRPRHAPPG